MDRNYLRLFLGMKLSPIVGRLVALEFHVRVFVVDALRKYAVFAAIIFYLNILFSIKVLRYPPEFLVLIKVSSIFCFLICFVNIQTLFPTETLS